MKSWPSEAFFIVELIASKFLFSAVRPMKKIRSKMDTRSKTAHQIEDGQTKLKTGRPLRRAYRAGRRAYNCLLRSLLRHSCEASTTAPAVHIGDLLLTLDIEVHLQVRTASAFLLQLDASPYLTPIPQPFAILGIPSLSQSPIQQSLNPKRSCKFLDLPKPQVSFPATILLGVLIFRLFPQTNFGVPALPQNCEFLPPRAPLRVNFPATGPQ